MLRHLYGPFEMEGPLPPIVSPPIDSGNQIPAGRSDPGPPGITVVVNAYRRRTYLREAVQSVLDQTLPAVDYEIVVVKDFPDDELDRWLAGLGPGVRVVTEDHPGVGAGLARGAEVARGEIVAFLEDDDRFHRDKLRGTVECFHADSRVGFLRNASSAIDAEGRAIPSWEKLRPAPSENRTLDPLRGSGNDLPWVFRYAPNINVSTMMFRTETLRPRLGTLRQVAGAVDSFLFVVAAASGRLLAVRRDRWNDYRVHPSLSHASFAAGNESADLRDLLRSRDTGELMESVLRDGAPSRFARRFVTSFRLEVEVTIFLLDPSARFSLGQWVGLGRTALWRRQRYLLVSWAFCLYRWLAPTRAARAYRTRRTTGLRRAAGVATGD